MAVLFFFFDEFLHLTFLPTFLFFQTIFIIFCEWIKGSTYTLNTIKKIYFRVKVIGLIYTMDQLIHLKI